MGNGENMKELLRPLGVYKLESSFLGAELDSLGYALDCVQEYLETIQREMCLSTAKGAGVDRISALFASRPVAQDTDQLTAALVSLMRISGDSFTLQAINDAISGCGINARVAEGEVPGKVEVTFPGVAGTPDSFEQIRTIIEQILPAHLQIQYAFWYQNWQQMQERMLTWQEAQAQGLNWEEMQKMVY